MMIRYAGGPHRPYDPLLDERPRRRRFGAGATAAVAISLLVHAGLFLYLWMVKFQPHYEAPASDPGVRVTIARPVEPPPPPTIVRVDHAPPPLAPHLTPPSPTPTPSLQVPPALAPLAEPAPPPLVVQGPPLQPPSLTTQASPPPSTPPVITDPDWVSQPNGDDLAQYYPERAQRLEKTGSAVIQCTVTTSGALSGCRVLSETPEGFGFGQATLKVARLFRMKPAMQGAQAVQGVVDIPLRWRLK